VTLTDTTADATLTARARDEARRRADDVIAEAVTFPAGGVLLAGAFYRPAVADSPLPAVVVTGTWTSIREQMADRYAARLAAHGFTTLAFDHTGYGASAGFVRNYESPVLKTRDIHDAVSYLSTRTDLVDPSQIAALGVCASAGYTTSNAVDDPRVLALALIAPWLHDAAIAEQIYGGPDGVAERMRAAAIARTRHELDGTVDYVPAVSASNPLAAMPFDIDFYQDPQRGAVPAWPNRFATMAWPGWLTYDPIALAPRVQQPTLIVHSDQAAIPDGARRFAAALTDSTVEWRNGTQFDFYDNDSHVDLAVSLTAKHLSMHLPV
jgi:uncharacterized protein